MPRALILILSLSACTSVDPSLLCGGGGTCVAVTTSSGADGGSGALASVDIDTSTPTLDRDKALDAHTSMYVHGDELYVVQHDSGTVRIYDPHTYALKVELPVGDGDHPSATAQPRDVWKNDDDGTVWVTLAGNTADSALAILDPSNPGTNIYIGLPQDPSDPDGKPEPSRIHGCNTKLYILLASSHVATDGSLIYGQGRIAIVAHTKRNARGVIDLAGSNPVDITAINGNCNDVVVANASDVTGTLDGSGTIQRLDLSKGSSIGVLGNDVKIGGKPLAVTNTNDSRLYVGEYLPGMAMTKVVAFDLATNAVTGDITPLSSTLAAIHAWNGKLVVASDNLFIGNDDGSMLTASAINLGATPIAIAPPTAD